MEIRVDSNRCPCDLSQIDRTRFDSWFYVKEDSRERRRIRKKEKERERGIIHPNRRGRPISPIETAASRSTYRDTKRRLSAGTRSLFFISHQYFQTGGSIDPLDGESLPLKCINSQPIKG